MTENEISEALKDPRIAKNNPLYLEIAFGMVDKKENKVVSINEVNSIVNNPYVKQYLAL